MRNVTMISVGYSASQLPDDDNDESRVIQLSNGLRTP